MTPQEDFRRLGHRVDEAQAMVEPAGRRPMKGKWQAHLSDLHGKVAGKEREGDRRPAEIRAGGAVDYPADAVDFAIAAVQETEYTALDTVLAGSNADTLAGS